MTRGGKRKGAGRPKGEPCTYMRIPESLVPSVRDFVNSYRQNKKKSRKEKVHIEMQTQMVLKVNDVELDISQGSHLFREDANRKDGYFIDWDYLMRKEGLKEKLEQFLELGKSIIKETDGLFPDGLSVEGGQVITMNGEVVESEEGQN